MSTPSITRTLIVPFNPSVCLLDLTWSTETFADNPNANAIRWGTLYNFRFDADQSPRATTATIGFWSDGRHGAEPGSYPVREIGESRSRVASLC